MALIRKGGKAYDSGDVIITMDGVMIDEVKDITYGTDQEHQVNHSLSNDPTSWSMGKITHKSTITLYMAAVVMLEKMSGGNLLSKRPFDIQVSFVNEYNEIVNDTLTVKFQSQGRDVTGEMGLVKQFDLFVLNINYLT